MPHSTVDPYDSYGKKKCEKQIRIIHAFNNPAYSRNIYKTIYVFSDPNVLAATLTGHTDAVWSLSYLGGNHQQLLSASADGTVKLWSPISKSTSTNVGPQQLVKTFGYSPSPGM